MRTIRTKIYKFEELSNEAQQNAIDTYRNKGIDTDYIYDEAYNTVKEFHKIFNTKESTNSWLEINASNIDDNILELKGLRLRTYLINNFWDDLYKRKYINSYFQETEPKTFNPYRRYKQTFSRKENKNGFWVTLRKKCFFENSCVLTGVCYDDDILQPIYNFIDNYKQLKNYNDSLTFEELLNECLDSLDKSIENEIDGLNTDDSIVQILIDNEYEFTEEGNIF